MMSEITLVKDDRIERGCMALWHKGALVWVGGIEPIVLDCDRIMVSPDDFDEINRMLDQLKSVRKACANKIL